MLTWLAPRYQDEGLSAERAGLLLTFFTVVQVGGALVVPALAQRGRDRRPWFALTLAATAVGLCAIAVVPLASPWGWTALVGFGIGGLFPLALTLPLDHAPDPASAGRLTAMMLGVGYLLAALGPFGVGVLRDATGGYGVSFGTLAALCVAMLAIALPLFGPRRTRRPRPLRRARPASA